MLLVYLVYQYIHLACNYNEYVRNMNIENKIIPIGLVEKPVTLV